jgi:hypothetical protein
VDFQLKDTKAENVSKSYDSKKRGELPDFVSSDSSHRNKKKSKPGSSDNQGV